MGARPVSEALTLKVEDIDFSQSMVTIEHLKSRIRLAYSQCGTRLGKSHGFCPGCAMVVDMRVTEEKHHPV